MLEERLRKAMTEEAIRRKEAGKDKDVPGGGALRSGTGTLDGKGVGGDGHADVGEEEEEGEVVLGNGL